MLPTTPDKVAVPIVTLDAKTLEQSGVTSNALEILRKSVPAFAGRSNAGTSNASNDNQRTGGGSQVQLRNLPTLVLVNGRRVAIDAVAGTNGKNFVDVNQIPAAAIDHIEVLTDGASSIYGSDAIGGVVNFITKSDAQGVKAGGRFGSASGDYRERSAYLSGGTEIAGFGITATGSYSKTNPLFQDTRSFTSPLYGRTSNLPGTVNVSSSSPGAILAPGLNSPSQTNPTGAAATASSVNQLIANGTYIATTPGAVAGAFDVSPYQTLLLGQEQDSFVSSLSRSLFDKKVELFGDVLYSHNRSLTQWLPSNLKATVPAGAPYNPLTTNFSGVTFTDLNDPRGIYDSTNASRATLGLRGKMWGHWQWETGVVYSESDFRQNVANLLYKPNIPLAIAGGFDASGNALPGGGYSQVPAGDVDFAVGASWRREALSGHADANGRVTDPVTHLTSGNAQLWVLGFNFDPFAAHRNISALFGETRIPITAPAWSVPGLRSFDITLAGRREHYSDTGSSTVPKLGFRWQPFDKQVTLRGTYAKSFSAPTLYAEYGPIDTRQVGEAVIAGVFGRPNYSGMPFNGEDGNNPTLKPATSVSRSIGVVFKPQFVPGLSATVDFSSINLYGFAGGLGFNNILASVNQLGSTSRYFNNIAVDNFLGAPGASQPFVSPGDLLRFLTDPATGKGSPAQASRLYVIDQFQNLAVLQERSYTIGADYILPWDSYGTFTLATSGAVFKSFNFQDQPGHPFLQYAGKTNNAGASGGFGGTLPTYRFFTSLDWRYRDLEITVNNTYVSGTDDTGVNGTSTPLIPVSSYSTWDLREAYDWHLSHANEARILTFALGVNNLTNRLPPLAPRAFVDNNADVATFSPLGRFVYGTVTVTF
ncbi:MAG: hypothetical protein E6K38_14805 [Gammaproteobacteria bacterium]|nr:MAG: hypothetical protein E6K38_14805 [Gammaproteobacteria bacterium]